jgi:ferredoxin
MKITIDADKCQGHGRCYAIAPELFDLDDNGHAFISSDEFPETARTQAELAMQNCPEGAITIE